MNHYIFDIKINDLKLDRVENLFEQIVSLLNLTVLKKESYIFDNGGFTIFWLLAESHLSAHYRIEDAYLAFDIYSCRNLENYEEKLIKLIQDLGNYKLTKLNRTFKY